MIKPFVVFLLAIIFRINDLVAQPENSWNNLRTKTGNFSDALLGFQNIQDSARTKVWWFHGETETTHAGITADLEAYRKAGVGGVVYYDQVHGKAENAFDALSPQWWLMLLFASQEAKRLGLSFEVHVSNGYVAGGPWIKPENGMQRLTSSEWVVTGGGDTSFFMPVPKTRYNYYKDVAVLAIPYRERDIETSKTTSPSFSSNKSDVDASSFFIAEKLGTISSHKPGESVFLTLDFKKEFTARCITYEMRARGKATTSATNVPGPSSETFTGTGYRILPDFGQLEVSSDGIHYKKVCNLKPIYQDHSSWRQKTLSFPAVTGRYFRLNLHNWWEENEKNQSLQIGKIVLSARASVDQWEEKAALYSEYIDGDQTPAYSKDETIDPNKIIDLTDKMDSLGVVHWNNVPSGKWLVLRFAHVPTGASIKHGRKNLSGLECDRLSATAAEIQWNNYFKIIADSIETHGARLEGMAIDSHEAGSQNWTPGFEKKFTRLRGYELKTYWPVLAGYVVKSREESDGFLFDMRRTVADLVSANFYGTLQRLCEKRKLTFTAQATGNALCLVADQIQAKGRVSKPQGEFWGIHPNGNYDIKESSSAAHLYGKKIASGEAFTDVKYSDPLSYIKQLADYAYCFGINEFVVCASAYQPWLDKIPGSTGGGRQYCLNRNNIYWPYSRGFWDYQARCASIMRQGMPVVDLCVYLGDNAPVKILTHRLPDIPGGFDFDATTADALLSRMNANDGRITLPDGMSYRMLILPRNGEVGLEALRKIASLVKEGVPVYGARPVKSGTLKDLEHMAEYTELVNAMWGSKTTSQGSNNYGKGKVYWGMSLDEAIKQATIKPDIALKTGDTKTSMIYFAHRKLTDADVYFLDNHKDTREDNIFTLAATGKYAQLWNTVTGERFSLPVLNPGKESVSIKLSFYPRESYMVVITNKKEQLPAITWLTPTDETQTVSGSWQVYFDEKLGGPGNVTFDSLTDWTVNADQRIKYYSGTAVYKKKVSINPQNDKIYLDLGNPGSIARIFINSKEAGLIWCSPWMLDITKYLVNGVNEIEIHVANSLMNRMIYDVSLPENERVTYAYPVIATSKDKLEPSGLKQVKLIRKP
jgi:hypothetical protein